MAVRRIDLPHEHDDRSVDCHSLCAYGSRHCSRSGFSTSLRAMTYLVCCYDRTSCGCCSSSCAAARVMAETELLPETRLPTSCPTSAAVSTRKSARSTPFQKAMHEISYPPVCGTSYVLRRINSVSDITKLGATKLSCTLSQSSMSSPIVSCRRGAQDFGVVSRVLRAQLQQASTRRLSPRVFLAFPSGALELPGPIPTLP